MNLVDVLNHLQMGQRMQHNARRMDAQVDMHLRERCGDSYQAPDEDDMGNNLLNNVFIGDDAITQLRDLFTDSNQQNATTAPAAATQPTPAPANSQTPAWKKALGTAAIVGATAVGTGAVMNYLSDDTDTDTLNVYEIEAVPFDPTAPIE